MWDPPIEREQNGIIQGYDLNYTDFLGKSEEKRRVTETYFVVADLTPFTQYNFSVRAFTIVGPGPTTVVQNTTAETSEFSLCHLNLQLRCKKIVCSTFQCSKESTCFQ